MTWTHYLLVFRLESPLHIGHRKVGNLMQTRRYVPGKVLWGALTAHLVRLAGQGDNGQAYQKVGEQLAEYFRFGYLWPTHQKGDSCPTKPHFPWDEPEDRAYWDYLYLSSRARTALEAYSHTAAEGMLYDVEFIAPHTREGNPVYLVGDLWVKENLPQNVDNVPVRDKWQQALRVLRLGGERGYGWGRVERCLLEPTTNKETAAGFSWREEQGNEVVVNIPEASPIPTHALATGNEAVSNIQGMVEPLVGWEQQPDGIYKISTPLIAYMPGSIITQRSKMRVNTYGIWAAVNNLNTSK